MVLYRQGNVCSSVLNISSATPGNAATEHARFPNAAEFSLRISEAISCTADGEIGLIA